MIYSSAIATSGLPRLHSQKLSGDAFIQLNGDSYLCPLTHCHCSGQMLVNMYRNYRRRSFIVLSGQGIRHFSRIQNTLVQLCSRTRT